MNVTELLERVGITMAIEKWKRKGVRFLTLDAICKL